MKNVWSPASASARVSASIQPSAPSMSGATVSLARRDAFPVDDRRIAGGETARELLLIGAEEADREAAGGAEELVARRLLPDRDADERRLERERDERRDRDAHPVPSTSTLRIETPCGQSRMRPRRSSPVVIRRTLAAGLGFEPRDP